MIQDSFFFLSDYLSHILSITEQICQSNNVQVEQRLFVGQNVDLSSNSLKDMSQIKIDEITTILPKLNLINCLLIIIYGGKYST